MKKKCLKVISVLVCLALSAGFASCGLFGGNDDNDNVSSSSVSSTIEGESSPSEEPLCSEDSSEYSSSEEEILIPTEGVVYKSFGTYSLVTGYTGSETEVVIADTYKNNLVTGIDTSAFARKDIVKIIMPDSITTIGEGAFASCESLIEVVMSDSITTIGKGAFNTCKTLTEIVIPEGVRDIGKSAFAWCENLTKITLPYSVDNIGESAFSYCSSLMEIFIPSTVNYIDRYAFQGCNSLTRYCAAKSQPSHWNDYWGYGCLGGIVWDCYNNDVATDGYVYTVVDGLRYMMYPNSSFVMLAPQPNTITKVNILSEIIYKDKVCKVVDINARAFSGCSKLIEVIIPHGIEYIGSSAFADCNSLTKIVIPDSVTSIGNNAFEDCSSLIEIVIPDSVTSIGGSAFAYCDKLTIYCEAKSKPNGWGSRWNPSGCPIVWGHEIEVGEANTGEETVGTEGLVYYEIDDGMAVIGYQGTATEVVIPATHEGKPVVEVLGFAYHSNLTKIVMPNSVKRIGGSAFVDCDGLTEFTIPDSVTSIGALAFQYCDNLTKIVVPKSMTVIGEAAFSWCTGLKEVVLHDGVTEIGVGAFDCCENLTEIVIPNSVTSIASQAFINCSALTKIVIPESVTSIGDYAFAVCNQLTVSCRALIKPLDWSDIWNKLDMNSDAYCPVVWGYKGE